MIPITLFCMVLYSATTQCMKSDVEYLTELLKDKNSQAENILTTIAQLDLEIEEQKKQRNEITKTRNTIFDTIINQAAQKITSENQVLFKKQCSDICDNINFLNSLVSMYRPIDLEFEDQVLPTEQNKVTSNQKFLEQYKQTLETLFNTGNVQECEIMLDNIKKQEKKDLEEARAQHNNFSIQALFDDIIMSLLEKNESN